MKRYKKKQYYVHDTLMQEDKDGEWVKYDEIKHILRSIAYSSTIGQAVRVALIGLDDWTEENEENSTKYCNRKR